MKQEEHWDMLYFEGPEKKVEIAFASHTPSLREFPASQWEIIAEKAKARIISSMSNPHCDAYLLSESSLFVFDHRVVMITCGQTTLTSAIAEILRTFSLDDLLFLIYERKNHNYPDAQPFTFDDDTVFLQESMPGRILRFGSRNAHHVMLFHLDREYDSQRSDMTLEILMHDIPEEIRAIFQKERGGSLGMVHEKTVIREILPGFQVDESLFEPMGYSLNAIRNSEYYTIHVTPQEVDSYVSFETNHDMRTDLEQVVLRVLEIFLPRSCDVLLFHACKDVPHLQIESEKKKEEIHKLSCGFTVRYTHLEGPLSSVRH